jgi:hypothetical protein
MFLAVVSKREADRKHPEKVDSGITLHASLRVDPDIAAGVSGNEELRGSLKHKEFEGRDAQTA